MMNVIWALFYKFAGAGLGFLLTVFTSWLFGPTMRGFITILSNNLALYQPVIGSFSEYMPYAINKQRRDVRAVFSSSLVFCFLLAGTLFALALILTPWLSQVVPGDEEPYRLQTIWFAGLVAPFALFHVYVTRLVWALDEQQWLNRLNMVQPFLIFPMMFVAWLVTPTGEDATLYAMIAWLSSYIVTSFISAYVARTRCGVSLRPRIDGSIRQEIIAYGSKLAGGRLLSQINYRLDVYLVFLFLGATSTGVYGIAVTTADMLGMVSGSILQVVMARMSSLEAKDSTQLTARTFRHSTIIVIVSMIGLGLLMPVVIEYAFPEKFDSSIQNLWFLLPGAGALGLAQILQTYFTNQLGRPQLTILLESGSILVNVTTAVILMPLIGVNGAAIAKSVAFFASLLFSAILFARLTQYPFRKLFILQQEEIAQYKSLFRKIAARFKKKTDAA